MENIRAIRTEADYDWALEEIAAYFENEPEPGTPEAERFDVLADLIESYEAKYWSIEAPDPIDALVLTLEMKGLKQSDLAAVLGSRSRASEILNRKRHLNMQMVQKLHEAFAIPAEVLIRPYHLAD